ncbi:hypothetical protein ACFWVP_06690 [Streptomyces sp. NPDC058637]|uniref:hypothetical protein n=1 Tax=Streptomyces sp. NPDC058637 TaxID=3346569 RepID=UPI003654382B
MAVDLSFFRSETSQRLRAEGRAEGKAEGLAEAVVRVLERRGVSVSREVSDRVHGCTDTGVLDEWLVRALAVAEAEELFTEV